MKEADLKIEAVPTREPGGQHAGGPYYGVRVTHLPTKITAYCECERSQYRNKAVASLMIEFALIEIDWKEQP